MNGANFSPSSEFNPDDEQDWSKILGGDKTDELDKINAEEEQEIIKVKQEISKEVFDRLQNRAFKFDDDDNQNN